MLQILIIGIIVFALIVPGVILDQFLPARAFAINTPGNNCFSGVRLCVDTNLKLVILWIIWSFVFWIALAMVGLMIHAVLEIVKYRLWRYWFK